MKGEKANARKGQGVWFRPAVRYGIASALPPQDTTWTPRSRVAVEHVQYLASTTNYDGSIKEHYWDMLSILCTIFPIEELTNGDVCKEVFSSRASCGNASEHDLFVFLYDPQSLNTHSS